VTISPRPANGPRAERGLSGCSPAARLPLSHMAIGVKLPCSHTEPDEGPGGATRPPAGREWLGRPARTAKVLDTARFRLFHRNEGASSRFRSLSRGGALDDLRVWLRRAWQPGTEPSSRRADGSRVWPVSQQTTALPRTRSRADSASTPATHLGNERLGPDRGDHRASRPTTGPSTGDWREPAAATPISN